MIGIRLFFVGVLMLFSINAVAAGRLEVNLYYPADAHGSRLDAGAGKVEVVLLNTGDQSIDVVLPTIPSVTGNGFLTNNLFEVIADDGVRASYIGIDLVSASLEGPYVTIAPGESRVYLVSIRDNYRVRAGGKYDVKLRPVRYLRRPRASYMQTSAQDIRALLSESQPQQVLTLWIDPRLASPSGISRQLLFDESAECEDWQLNEFEHIKAAAASLANEAFWHYNDLFVTEWLGMPPWFTWEFTASQRYTKWFGVDPVADMNQWAEDDLLLYSTLQAIPERMGSELVAVTCHCEAGKDRPDAMAYIQRPYHYIINSCPAFWQSPRVPTFKDQPSQVGTLIHEASHFEDSLSSPGTEHHAEFYDNASTLAGVNRSLAIRNSNTYKFYVLNQSW
ncbi:M35 family metallo-endopeptidase [Marilutibacter spongiae]|uniref:Lysine-specific metallo-endopeptidase domain-containing protein n=1 Tax=Marilutibacter spongiae TaxID=2025720 RepID=A0A7W3TMY2_9GAMM|nr:M35 family metallo-endopeptidase [Lysobacter spongiae]MBB1061297.1 hypothetical protein [Lysobacter spongiae]